MNLLNEYEHTLIDAELHEIEAAEAEMNLYIEDEKGQLNVKMSKRSWDIIMAAIGYVRDLKEMDGGNND